MRDLSFDPSIVEAVQSLYEVEGRDLAFRVDRERIGIDLRGDLPASTRKALDQLLIEPPQLNKTPPAAERGADGKHERPGKKPADSWRAQSFGILKDEFSTVAPVARTSAASTPRRSCCHRA